MRICLVSPYDLSEPGGVNKHVEFLAAALRDGGDEVEVIGPSTLPASREFRTGFPGVFSLEGNGSDNRIGLLTPPRSIRRFFQSRELDVLHVHEPLIPMLPWYAVHWARASARVATFHAYTANEPRVTRLARKALSPLLRRFDGGIAVSPAAARYASVAWPGPLTIIPNGADTSFLARTEAREHASPRPVRFVFVGRYTDRRKGFATLFEAYRRIRAEVSVELHVVGLGEPSAFPPVPGVTFHGVLTEAELRARLHESDVLVAPSTGQESFGMVLIEGMAAGLPVLCSDIEGYRQVAGHDGACLVPPEDVAALADAMLRLARDPSRRRLMGLENLLRAREYDWRRIAERVRAQYELAIERATGCVPIRSSAGAGSGAFRRPSFMDGLPFQRGGAKQT